MIIKRESKLIVIATNMVFGLLKEFKMKNTVITKKISSLLHSKVLKVSQRFRRFSRHYAMSRL